MSIDKHCVPDVIAYMQTHMSEKRFTHTIGVANTAVKIGRFLIPQCCDELFLAGLLHDITKELPIEEQIRLIKEYGVQVTQEDLATPAVLHSFSGVAFIRRNFPDLATTRILSAVEKHTLGDADMSVFDKIIYLADYIEPGRMPDSCVKTRDYLFDNLSSESLEKSLQALDHAMLMALDFTFQYLRSARRPINTRSIRAKSSLESSILQ